MMKKLSFVFLTLLLCAVLFSPALGVSGPTIKTTLVKYEPAPAEPGGYVDVWVKVENIGDGTAKAVAFELLPEYPFSLESGVSSLENIGIIWPLQQVTFDYRLRVDEDALEGNHSLDFSYRADSTQRWINSSFSIRVQSQRMHVGIESVESDPYIIRPGEYATVAIVVKNFEESTARDLTVKFDTSAESLPFSPVIVTTEAYTNRLDGGEEETFTFKVLIDSDAAAGAYKVPVYLGYSDRFGNEYSKTDTASLVIGAPTSIQVALDSTTINQGGQMGQVVIIVTNNGMINLKFVTLRVLDGSEDGLYDLISPSQEYLGNIESDDFETANFDLYVSNETGNRTELLIPVEVEYTDASTNQKHTLESEISVRLYTYEELLRMGLAQEPSYTAIFVVLAIVFAIVGIVVYKKIKRRKARNK